jgi:hypothetical protein
VKLAAIRQGGSRRNPGKTNIKRFSPGRGGRTLPAKPHRAQYAQKRIRPPKGLRQQDENRGTFQATEFKESFNADNFPRFR